ncbi:Chymotrypsin-like elastase family member 1 [Seminavis robusta]|uniref:Chymotrypsin-like elastase family member 1 n=1 Tax=Seminavis robusta TaxID=568900 RepID=A0A9N8DEV7_9STRA|nr:Chymotrypsin-like elastase family member 1 [Seminavis robusta]|eukprot:Sro107_g054000.1 Chymotrypsin-like elastase family member 1 (313) ;mRNA; r:96790-98098
MSHLSYRLLVATTIVLSWSACDSQNVATNSSIPSSSHVRKLRSDRQWTEETGMVFKEGPFIVNGGDANTAETPWFVHFGNGACGASLISKTRVLTAAHCVRSGAPATVRVGATTQSDGTEIRVRCVKKHPNYDNFVTNDIAIIKLASEAPTDSFIAINTDAGNPSLGEQMTAIGLGRTSSNGGVASRLLAINVNYVDPGTCNIAYGGGVDSNFHLCATTNGNGVCNGDSGGPLYDSAFAQVGVVSFGSSGGCGTGVPDGYTRVSHYSQWIQEQLTDDSCDGCSIYPTCAQIFNSVVSAVTNAARYMFRGDIE